MGPAVEEAAVYESADERAARVDPVEDPLGVDKRLPRATHPGLADPQIHRVNAMFLALASKRRVAIQGQPGTDAFANWFGALFYLPAVAGGIFGLLGGYLTDRLGRRRVLTWSILAKAGSLSGQSVVVKSMTRYPRSPRPLARRFKYASAPPLLEYPRRAKQR